MKIKLSGINEETGEPQTGFIYYKPDTQEILITYPDEIERRRLYKYLTTPQLLIEGIQPGQSNSEVIGHYKEPKVPSDSEEFMLHALSDMQGWISISADWRNPIKDDPNALKSLNGEIMYRLI